MERYNIIINNYNTYIKEKPYDLVEKEYDENIDVIDINQKGGLSYPLHHIMMGKGKSSVLTPILSLYFSLICKKEVKIIVPSHLLLDTMKIIDEYKHVFNSDNILILSDDTAKEYFLENKFKNDDKSIMIIDEFDYLIDPLRSNFNITINKNKSTMDIFDILVPDDDLKTIEDHKNYLLNIRSNKKIQSLLYKDQLIDDLEKILKDIEEEKLVENIKWGIHPTKFYAIPFKHKDTPLITSNFSSHILTIYLTLYYYIIINNYEITDTVVNCIISNGLFNEIFNMEEPIIYNIDYIKGLILDDEFKINKLFKILFKNIFEKIKIANYQYNTSFIDLINIDNLYKIGYSGTLNIIPLNLNTEHKFDKTTKEDIDEKKNIKFAIEKSDILKYINDDELFKEILKDNYDSIIDCIGLFKNYNNKYIAIKLFDLFDKKRNIIFIDNNDHKFVILKENKNIVLYDFNINYENPFIYFDQGHILGIDIKQDMYPIMKGLCIINDNSLYSEIAQGMYRLRKLNMGHSIIFLYKNNTKTITKDNLFDELIKREETYNKSKKINLEYQILKSDLRKKRNFDEIQVKYKDNKYKNDKYDIRYFEKVKYYNLENMILDDVKVFEEIFYDEEKKSIPAEIIKNIARLVYNLNSYDSSHIIEKSTLIESEKTTLIESEKITLRENILNQSISKDKDIINFEFNDYSVINNSIIKYNPNIEYLPNIFTQVNGINFINNKSGYLFIYKDGKILLIPGYLITYYEEYPILNYKLNYVNEKRIEIEKLIKLKELDFFKVLYNKDKNKIDKIDFILYRILSDKKIVFEYQNELLSKYIDEKTDILTFNTIIQTYNEKNISYINTVSSKKYIKINNVNKFFDKYLIYKKKYLKLKLDVISNGE
jgi:hypothetical protein